MTVAVYSPSFSLVFFVMHRRLLFFFELFFSPGAFFEDKTVSAFWLFFCAPHGTVIVPAPLPFLSLLLYSAARCREGSLELPFFLPLTPFSLVLAYGKDISGLDARPFRTLLPCLSERTGMWDVTSPPQAREIWATSLDQWYPKALA